MEKEGRKKNDQTTFGRRKAKVKLSWVWSGSGSGLAWYVPQ